MGEDAVPSMVPYRSNTPARTLPVPTSTPITARLLITYLSCQKEKPRRTGAKGKERSSHKKHKITKERYDHRTKSGKGYCRHPCRDHLASPRNHTDRDAYTSCHQEILATQPDVASQYKNPPLQMESPCGSGWGSGTTMRSSSSFVARSRFTITRLPV